jgi:hypothetical protein
MTELNDLTEDLVIGDKAGGNNTTTETDGTQVSKGDATCWDDQRFPANAANLDVSSGRIDYNYDEMTVDYADNSRYPNEVVGIAAQMSHARKDDSDIYPHLHWNQTSSDIPNILVEYRWYNNDELVPAGFTQIVIDTVEFTYPGSGNFAQISSIPLLGGLGAGKRLSSFFDIRIFRDVSNASILFPGVDTYAGVWALKEFDIHIEIDMNGSRQEFIK